MTVYSFICYLFTSAKTLVLKIIRRYGQKKKTDEQTNKKEKEKTTEDKNDTIITSGWVILDKLFRNFNSRISKERVKKAGGREFH